MKTYQFSCEKFTGPVIIDEDNIIVDVMCVFNKFKGQKLEAFTYWLDKRFGYCVLKKLNKDI